MMLPHILPEPLTAYKEMNDPPIGVHGTIAMANGSASEICTAIVDRLKRERISAIPGQVAFRAYPGDGDMVNVHFEVIPWPI